MASLLDRSLGDIRTQRPGRSAPTPQRDATIDNESGWKHDMYDSAPAAPAALPRGPRAGGQQGGPQRLMVRNLHYEVSEEELKALFTQIGPILPGPDGLGIAYDTSGRSRGLAWVIYAAPTDAARAKEAFDGAPAKGQKIAISFDYNWRPKVEKPELLKRMDEGAADPYAKFGSRNRDRDDRAGGGDRNDRDRNDRDRPAPYSRDSRPRRSGGGGGGGDYPRGGRDGDEGGSGPVRSSRGGGGGGRGGRGGRGGGRERGERGEKREAKTAEELDRELEAFMSAPSGGKKEDKAPAGGDVEMAA